MRSLIARLLIASALLVGCTPAEAPRVAPAVAAPAPPSIEAAPRPAAAAPTSLSPTAPAMASAPAPAATSTQAPAATETATLAAPAPTLSSVSNEAPPAAPTPPAVAAALPPVAASPTGFHLRIPAVGIDAPIVAVGLEADGSMAAPDGPDVVGWFAPGPRPGQRGNVLLDGHVDWTDRQTGIPRTAVFYPLKNAQAGHDIVIDADGRRHTYRIRETLLFAWDDPRALRVLQPTAEAVVTLITCEGSFDRVARNYSHRRVVVAALVASE